MKCEGRSCLVVVVVVIDVVVGRADGCLFFDDDERNSTMPFENREAKNYEG